MIIVHICLCDAYEENWEYHRNLASNYDITKGHKVYIVTSSLTTDKNAKWTNGESGISTTSNGIKVYRLNNRLRNRAIQGKLNGVTGLYNTLCQISPDLIMVHNLQSISLYDIAKYKKKFPNTILCGDSHADYFNSARNFISKYLLNAIVYKKIIKDNMRYFNKFFYHGESVKKFFEVMYSIKLSNYVISTIGAKVESQEIVDNKRIEIRHKLNWDDKKIYLVHSGKLEPRKKTKEILEALYKVKSNSFILLIIGNIGDDQRDILRPLIERDARVKFLGWKSSSELREYLLAADLYLQPGTMSITLYNSLACGTPAIVYPHDDYKKFFDGWEYLVKTEQEIIDVLNRVLENRDELTKKRTYAYNTAAKKLDISLFCEEMYRTNPNEKVI